MDSLMQHRLLWKGEIQRDKKSKLFKKTIKIKQHGNYDLASFSSEPLLEMSRGPKDLDGSKPLAFE